MDGLIQKVREVRQRATGRDWARQDASGLSREGLAVGNLIAAVVAMVGSLTITFLSHPAE